MKVLFFEIDAINVKRYYLDVLPEILENAEVSILIENFKELELLKSLKIDYPTFVIQGISLVELEEIIGNYDFIIINGQRIPDIMMTLLAHKSSTKVYYLQHGMYVPYMKRDLKFFFRKLYKTARYLKYAIWAARVDVNFHLLIKLIRSHLIDGVRNYQFKKFNGFPDKSFVFSEHWKKWHKKHYFNANYNQFIISGNPEVQRFEKIQYGTRYITYCYQTLIEDGRVDKNYLLDKINDINKWALANNKVLLVKAHPRMSNEVLEYLNRKSINVVMESLPVTNYVIGHYSSLLPIWSYLGSWVFSLQLDGDFTFHDESITKTTISIQSVDEIDFKISNNFNALIELKKNVDYYYNYTDNYSKNIWVQVNN